MSEKQTGQRGWEMYLLAIRGTLAPATQEAARKIHNETAGAPPNVAAARSLGDLSHMVYVPTNDSGPGAGEFLIMDLWNSMDGLNQFFANPTVQEQGGRIFSKRDPVVWAPAEGFHHYAFPAPTGRNDRIIGTVRGLARSVDEIRAAHNAAIAGQVNKARMAGNLSHEAYFRMAPPGSPEALEFLAVDVWMDAAGMRRHYDDPDFLAGFEKLFAGAPDAATWQHPAGQWVEW